MKNPSNLLIADLELFLKNKTQHLDKQSSLDGAFFSWTFDLPPTINLDLVSKGHEKVAILGFYNAIDSHKFSSSFHALLNWLVDRPLQLQGTPTAIVLDPFAIFGVLIGLAGDKAIPLEENIKSWLENLLAERNKLKEKGSWADYAINLLANFLGLSNQLQLTVGPELHPVRILMHSKEFVRNYPEISINDDINKLFSNLIREDYSEIENGLSITILSALKISRSKIAHLDINVLGVSTVVDLLTRIPEALSSWTWEENPRTRGGQAIKWDLQNEYHVQNLLFAILRPVFHDLKSEEPLTSSGHVHPRTDFLIPSLRLAIEVKFLRSNKQSELRKITEEIASDSHHYRIEKKVCDEIVVFIWDDSRSTEEHSKLKDAIEKMAGIKGVIIIPRPGKMLKEEQNEGN